MENKQQNDPAAELIEKFKPIVYPYIGSSMLVNQEDETVILKNATLCAIIAQEHAVNTLKGYKSAYEEDINHLTAVLEKCGGLLETALTALSAKENYPLREEIKQFIETMAKKPENNNQAG